MGVRLRMAVQTPRVTPQESSPNCPAHFLGRREQELADAGKPPLKQPPTT